MAVANKYDTTMLPPTVPGYEALNALKRDILYGNGQKLGVMQMGEDAQERISGNTSNPYARTIEDQLRCDEMLAYLLEHGHEGRDLYFRSRDELHSLFWQSWEVVEDDYAAWHRSMAHG